MGDYQNIIYLILVALLLAVILFQFYYYKVKWKRERDIEKVIKKERNLLQTLIDIIPDTIYYKDRNSRFLMINKAQANVLALNSPKEAIGLDDFDFFAHAQEAFDEEQKMMETGEPVINSIIDIKTVKGEHLDLMETKLPVYDDNGKCTGLVGISRNITELIDLQKELIKAKEKAEESDRLKSSFLANMSHEIRTPLNAIVGFSELLSEDDKTLEDKQEYIRIIKSNNELLLKLIEDILNLSRIESGALELNETAINLEQTFKDIAETHRLNLDEHVKLTCTVPPNNTVCLTDEGKLVQILNNLIANAIKFTTKGKIEIGYKHIDGKIEAFVSDTGEGIAEDKQESIFLSFVKSNEFKHGTGLGLAICKNLTKIMGGEIWVKSELGKGSTFSFTFPYKTP